MYIIVYTDGWGYRREFKASNRSSLILNANIVIRKRKSDKNWSIIEIKKAYLDEIL